MKYWIITDTHFNHKNIIEWTQRPQNFEAQILNGLMMLGKNDVLIHLGDVCVGKDSLAHKTFIQPLDCKKILCRGNHDRKSTSWYIKHGWDFVCDKFSMKYGGRDLVFSHIPVPPSMSREDYNIHGHFHNNDHRSTEPEIAAIYDESFHHLMALEIDGYHPVSLSWLVQQIIKNKEQS